MDEGQNVYVKDFRYKKTWMPGIVVERTGPVSDRILLDDGSVIRRRQDVFEDAKVKRQQIQWPVRY